MSGSPPSDAAIAVTRARVAALLADVCPEAGIDLAGAVGLPCRLPHADQWRAYVTSGRYAGLDYLARDPELRLEPTRRLPWARSLLVFAQRYTDGWEPGDRSWAVGAAPGRSWTDGVSRYARGHDYHDILLGSLRTVLTGLAAALPGLRAQPAVDTGPYLEREYAWLAGLGFLGKNGCLIHESLGSGLFLGVAPTNLAIAGIAAGPQPGPLYAAVPRGSGRAAGSGTERAGVTGFRNPATVNAATTARCGRCTRCLAACPTGALVAPFTLDARRCLATWTIEWQGRAPDAGRVQQGGLIFGCDICQAVCPWNVAAARRAAARGSAAPRAAYGTLAAHDELGLGDLLDIAADVFRRRFRRTPLWRCHRDGLRRNALTVAGAAGHADLLAKIGRIADSEADEETRRVAQWARQRLSRQRPAGEPER